MAAVFFQPLYLKKASFNHQWSPFPVARRLFPRERPAQPKARLCPGTHGTKGKHPICSL